MVTVTVEPNADSEELSGLPRQVSGSYSADADADADHDFTPEEMSIIRAGRGTPVEELFDEADIEWAD